MELVCEKYKEKMDSETAICRHPTEYCKFRAACLIHFQTREAVRNGGGKSSEERNRSQSDEKR